MSRHCRRTQFTSILEALATERIYSICSTTVEIDELLQGRAIYTSLFTAMVEKYNKQLTYRAVCCNTGLSATCFMFVIGSSTIRVYRHKTARSKPTSNRNCSLITVFSCMTMVLLIYRNFCCVFTNGVTGKIIGLNWLIFFRQCPCFSDN